VHLLPIPALAALLLSLQIGYVIIGGVALLPGAAFPPPTPAWGSMIAEGRDYVASAWWVSFFPGLAILLVVLAFTWWATGCATSSTRSSTTCSGSPGGAVRVSGRQVWHARQGAGNSPSIRRSRRQPLAERREHLLHYLFRCHGVRLPADGHAMQRHGLRRTPHLPNNLPLVGSTSHRVERDDDLVRPEVGYGNSQRRTRINKPAASSFTDRRISAAISGLDGTRPPVAVSTKSVDDLEALHERVVCGPLTRGSHGGPASGPHEVGGRPRD